ncbi:hypothetical protein NDU88_003572 [Pleurodeles waltl]|uniref:Uncharacterized protein n=1 Tax=Pleurodeles waltl TaxID=8319 RepID=A0AAV7SGC1_PLEWA|nr:hypothetical protein NDU88_003572 [Pleurodeles waltl]
MHRESVVQKAERPRQPEEEERENTEAVERWAERPHDRQRWPEQWIPGGNPDDGQGGPGTGGLHHVHGGAWVKQVPLP